MMRSTIRLTAILCRAINEGGAIYDASELDFATPTSSEPVSRGALSYSQKAE